MATVTTSSLWNEDLAAGTSRNAKWLYCPISTLEAALNNTAYVPSNAKITNLKLLVKADQESVGANVYLKYGFGGTSSISSYLYGSSSGDGNKVGSSPAWYPSESGVDITAYLSKNTASFGITRTYGDYLSFRFISGNYLGKTYFVNEVKLYITYEVHNHSYTSSVTLQPTCTEQGEKLHMCSCGDGYIEYLPALGHSWVNATCTTPKTCSRCGATEGAALGHSYTDVITQPTETANGYTTHTCTRCGHSYVDSYTCKATFKNYDGTVLKTETLEAGKTPTAPANPSRPADAQYTYTFSGWSPTVGAITTNTTYTAQFTATRRKYTIIWKNDDGTVLETDNNVEYGTTPTYNGATPTKASTAQHSYAFSGWSPAVSDVTGNATYTAQFTATVRKYTVKWYNYDGTLLATDTDVPYGTKPTYNGATPTKPSDDYYTYGFAGWSPSTDEAIQGDKNFTAQFAQTDRYYTVRWVNASAVQGVEGALLETDEVKFNTQPDYNGATPKHPKQDTDPALNYDFIGWSAKVTDPAKPDTELEKVKGNITYTAIYETTPKLYPIRFILFDTDDTVVLEYGTNITFEAPVVTGYQFVKWTDGNTDNPRTVTVTGEATYQAVYEIKNYTLRLSNREAEGSITGVSAGTYNHGTSLTATAVPVKGYKFKYWVLAKGDGTETILTDSTIQFNITDNITLGAVFEKIPPPDITFVQMLYQGKQISAGNKVPTEEYFRIVVGVKTYD